MARKKRNIEDFLNENPYEYYYVEANILTEKEMREHYSYLREVANKRLARFKGTEFEKEKIYKKNRDKFVPLKEIKNERELRHKLYEVNKFVRARASSVTGLKQIRNQVIETLRDRGITFVNKKNIKEFGQYMDFLRAKYGSKQFGSEQALTLYGEAVKKKIDPFEIAEDFGFWQEHTRELAQLPRIKGAETHGVEDYKRLLIK